ncbi:MAG TPA: PQQ-binding-like beta-propeller repeat protein [Spirochaetota bacterium]|nr:PQQ-binding-like beta-propeller repeat protein [Spirochaetota bacterium]
MEPHIEEEILAIIHALRVDGRCSDAQAGSLAAFFERAHFDDPPIDAPRGLARVRLEASKLHGRSAKARAFSARTKLLLAAASVFMIAGAAFLVFRAGDETIPHETVAAAVYGDVHFMRSGTISVLEAGALLGAGDTVRTGARAFAELRYGDKVTIRIKQNSRFRIDELAHGGDGRLRAGLDLSAGTALLSFKKLQRGDSAEVRTPTSVAGVRGTSFGVSVSENRDVRFEVLEGKISVRGRVVLDGAVPMDEAARGVLEGVERRLAERAVAVEANEVCEVKERDARALAKKIEETLAALPEKGKRAEETRLADAIIKIAAETANPRIYTAAESPPVLFRDLKRMAMTGEAADEAAVSRRERERPAAFDQNAWMDRAKVSYVVADDARQLFIAVGTDGRIDALRRGAVVWRFRCGSRVNAQPVSDGEIVFLATADERIIALSLDDGKELWSRKIDGVLHFGARLSIDGDGVYAATAKGHLYRFNRRGGEKWRLRLPAASYSTPVVDGRLLFVPAQDGKIHVVDTALRLVVMRIDSGKIIGSSVIVHGGRLYYANFDGVIACHNIERDETEWRYRLHGAVTADPVIDGDFLFAVSSGGDVVKLSLDGRAAWRVNIGGPVDRSPIVVGSGLYVLSRRVFYVFDTEKGAVQWSLVTPSESATNIAVVGRTMYFGTEENGIYRIKK